MTPRLPSPVLLRCLVMGILALFVMGRACPFFTPAPAFASGENAPTQRETGFNLGASLASLYRDHISSVDGDRCPSYPSCSSYSVEAFKKHGFFIGWMMTVDRLIHEGKEEQEVSPLVYDGGRWKIYDPVENNDFWWYPDKRSLSK